MTGPRKTIFVGNLPSDVPQAELRAKFTRFGSIDAMEIVVRHSLFGGGTYSLVCSCHNVN